MQDIFYVSDTIRQLTELLDDVAEKPRRQGVQTAGAVARRGVRDKGRSCVLSH